MNYHVITFIVCLTFLLSGCSEKEPTQSARDTSGQEVKEEVSEAVEKTGVYLGEQKDEIMSQANKTYQQLKTDTQQLISDIKSEGKENWEQINSQLNSKLDAVQEKLTDLKDAGQENWKDSQQAFDTAVTELQDAYRKTKAEFQDSESK